MNDSPPDKTWAARIAMSLSLLGLAYALLSVICRYRIGQPFPAGLDIVVRELPALDWTWVLSQGFVLFLTLFFLYYLRHDRRRMAYLITATALLMLVRDAFVLLTPVGPLSGLLPLYSGVAGIHNRLEYDGELFFSGHTGVPFMYGLLSLRHRGLSAVCFLVSMVNGMGVLLTRNHYSIDVLGAFVIVPTIIQLNRRFFGWLDPENEAAAR